MEAAEKRRADEVQRRVAQQAAGVFRVWWGALWFAALQSTFPGFNLRRGIDSHGRSVGVKNEPAVRKQDCSKQLAKRRSTEVDACVAFGTAAAPALRNRLLDVMLDVCRLPGTNRTSAPCGRQGAVEGNFVVLSCTAFLLPTYKHADLCPMSSQKCSMRGVPTEMSGGPCSADRFRAPARLAVEHCSTSSFLRRGASSPLKQLEFFMLLQPASSGGLKGRLLQNLEDAAAA